MQERQFVFASFRLDPASQQLWRGEELVALRPKLFAVLHRLLEHAGRLVTREELRAAVWPKTVISESVLRGTIRELRDALGDDAVDARFIETIPHRGYRFVAAVTTLQPKRSAPLSSGERVADAVPRATDRILIGREAELARLQQWLERAVSGTRQVVFVTGEPGIGKTTVVDEFLAGAAEMGEVWTARGQCIEHYGAGEAYLPVLEALGQLCRQTDGKEVIAVLSRYAPTWLAQMPGLIGDAELETVQRRVQGATRERMLRELAEALEALTSERTVVLTLEDLHWSDFSTLDLVSLLARRRMPARLFVLATYRPADVIVSGHPLKGMKQELLVHAQCEELPLRFLTDREVGQYLAARFPRQQLPPDLGQAIHRSTDGNPLFIVNVVDYWLSQRVLVETAGQWQLAARVEDVAAGVPESLRQMIEKQLERLTAEERGVLEVAGVVGMEFSTAAVAAGLDAAEEQIEQRCEGLVAQGRFLLPRGVDILADGTATGRYGFIHGLYEQVLYERLAVARRARLHQRIGEWGERALSARVKEPAAELAMHFERGQDYPRAIKYLNQAAHNAMRRQAAHEAVALLSRSLTLLNALPDSPGRAENELALLVAMGVPLLMTKGYAAPEVERTYARAREICRELGESPQLLPALAGLFRFYFVRADFQAARTIADQILRLAEHTQDRVVSLVAHSLLGALLLSLGEFDAAREHNERGIALYDSREHSFMASLYGDDPGVTCHCFLGLSLWYLGYPDQALASVEKAVAVAKKIGSPYCETFALDFVTWIQVLRRDEPAAQASADALMRIAPDQGFQFLLADSRILQGWILAAQGKAADGLQRVRPAIAAYEATGALMSKPSHLMLLAKVYGKAGQIDEALAALADARTVVDQTGERSYDAELHRLKGELMLNRSSSQRTGRKRQGASDAAAEAEACFQRAIELARRQRAKSLELRAATSLSRLWQQQGKRQQAQQMLGEIYGFFTEGLDTPDLQDARCLLAELART
jgi:DNA-binding winged helix-turn-helix (wHTH) protein/predicted ATPase